LYSFFLLQSFLEHNHKLLKLSHKTNFLIRNNNMAPVSIQTNQLCITLLWAISLNTSSAFVLTKPSFFLKNNRNMELLRKDNENETQRPTAMSYTYGDYVNCMEEKKINQEEHETIDIHTLVRERISSNRDYTSKLARLAVLFAPPDQQIILENINYVDVTHIDDTRIDLSVGVCEEHCITVWVPVLFAHPPSDGVDNSVDELEQWIIGSVESLLMSANDDDKSSNHNEDDHVHGVKLQPFQNPNNDFDFDFCIVENPCSFPQWWDHADGLSDRGMYEDCLLLEKLLNEDDFQYDLISVVQRELSPLTSPLVKKASVLAIGPAGVYIRARVGTNDAFQNNFDDDKIFDLPVSFSENKRRVIDVEALRASILDIFESS